MFMSPYYECCIAQKRDDDMNDPMLTETADYYLILFRHHRRAGRVGAYFGADGVTDAGWRLTPYPSYRFCMLL